MSVALTGVKGLNKLDNFNFKDFFQKVICTFLVAFFEQSI